MKTFLLLLALVGPWGFQEALLYLSGASCVEELSEDEVARYQSLAARPVDLNAAGRSRLLSSGLLTAFQVASLLDYRQRTGAVLSWTELGLVDGFSEELCRALEVFCVLGLTEGEGPGRREDTRVRQSVVVRGGASAVSAGSGGGSSGGGSAGSGLAFGSPAAVGGLKYEAEFGERAALFYSLRTTYSSPSPGWGTFSAAWYGRRVLGQVIVGNFAARFGQGLVQWSGFSLSGYNSLGAFRRNGTGFAATGSYSPELTGVATDWHFGPWRLSVAYSLGGTVEGVARGIAGAGRPIMNLTRTWRSASAGFTATAHAASLEARIALPGWALFAETALWYRPDGSLLLTPRAPSAASAPTLRTSSPSTSAQTSLSSSPGPAALPFKAVAGAIWVPSYGHKAGILGRWLGLGKDYSGVALGYEGPALSATTDAALRPDTRAFQLKSLLQWHPTLTIPWLRLPSSDTPTAFSTDSPPAPSPAGTSPASAAPAEPPTLQPLLRAQLRWRPADAATPSASATSPATSLGPAPFPFAAAGVRLDLRAALTATAVPWLAAARYDAVFGRAFAWHWYAELARRGPALSLYARGGLFRVDNWDDRIYVYERDAPGSFTVPARYGRGWAASLYAAWHLARRHTLWFRLETVQYPWALTPKDGRLELRLQYCYQH